MSPFLARFEGPIYAILRIMTGIMFMMHGTGKLFLWPQGKAVPATGSVPWIAGVLEVVCGALIAIGLFTSIASFVASGLMAAAYFIAHAPQGFFPIVNKGELAAVYCFLFLLFAARGSGPWSVDAMLARGKSRITS
jgi:putative oxidoreductase